MITKHPICLFGLLIAAFSSVGLAAQDTPSEVSETEYYYAYISHTPQDNTIYLIDPASPETAPQHFQIPFEGGASEYRAIRAVPSPDGRQLAIVAHEVNCIVNRGFDALFFYRMETSELVKVSSLFLDDVVWSDDNRFLAFNAYVPTEGSYTELTATYVYDTLWQSHSKIKQTTLGLPKVQPTYLTFAPDSVHLAVFNNSCWNYICTGILELYNTQNGTLTVTQEIPPRSNMAMDYTCIWGWSPDGRYLAFVSVCNEWAERYFSELFVWDTVENEVSQLTTYTNSPADFEASAKVNLSPPDHLVRYSVVWFNADILLVGAIVTKYDLWPDGSARPLFDQAIFDVFTSTLPDGKRHPINSDSKVYLNLSPHPTDKTIIAFREERYTPDAAGELLLDPYHAQNAVHIAAFDGQTFETIHKAEYGCVLKWSPDGEWLAYIATEKDESASSPCPVSISFNFLNNTTGEFNHYPATLTGINRGTVIGWIISPEDTP